jgi:hypothetical protein
MKLHVAVCSVVAIILLAGCDNGPWAAPPGSVIQEIDAYQISWFGCQVDPLTGEPLSAACDIEQPSPPVIFPLTLNVYDEVTEYPVNNVWLRVTSGYADIYLLPQEVIEALALPDTENWSDIGATAEVWAQFSGTWEGDYAPTFLETWTDNYGQAELWVWVQKMPLDPASGQAKQSSIMVDIGTDQMVIELQAGQ